MMRLGLRSRLLLHRWRRRSFGGVSWIISSGGEIEQKSMKNIEKMTGKILYNEGKGERGQGEKKEDKVEDEEEKNLRKWYKSS